MGPDSAGVALPGASSLGLRGTAAFREVLSEQELGQDRRWQARATRALALGPL